MGTQKDFNDVLKPAIFAEIEGVAIVTIPVIEYSRLLRDSLQLAEWHVSHSQLINPSRSSIARDPEVAIFFANGFGLRSVASLVKECKKRFGSSRTPSSKAAYRYWESLRIKERSERGKTVANRSCA